MNQQFYKNMALWVVILVMILLLVTMLRQGETAPPDIAYSEFLHKLDRGELEHVTIEEGHIQGRTTDFYQRVERLEVRNQPTEWAGPGTQVGLQVDERVREHDVVYKISS